MDTCGSSPLLCHFKPLGWEGALDSITPYKTNVGNQRVLYIRPEMHLFFILFVEKAINGPFSTTCCLDDSLVLYQLQLYLAHIQSTGKF